MPVPSSVVTKSPVSTLNAPFPGRRLVRWALIVPWAASLIMTSKLFVWLYDYYFGLVNRALVAAGLLSANGAAELDARNSLLPQAWITLAQSSPKRLLSLGIVPIRPAISVRSSSTIPVEIFRDGIAPISLFSATQPEFPILQAAAHIFSESAHHTVNFFSQGCGDAGRVFMQYFPAVTKSIGTQILSCAKADRISRHGAKLGM